MTEEDKLILQTIQGFDPAGSVDKGFMLGTKIEDRRRALGRERAQKEAVAKALDAAGPNATPEEVMKQAQGFMLESGLVDESFAMQEKYQSAQTHRMDTEIKGFAQKLRYMDYGAKLGDAIMEGYRAGQMPEPRELQRFAEAARAAGYEFDDPANPTQEEIYEFITGARGAQREQLEKIVTGYDKEESVTQGWFRLPDGTLEPRELMRGTPPAVTSAGITTARKGQEKYTDHKTKQQKLLSDPTNLAKVRGVITKYDYLNGKYIVKGGLDIQKLESDLLEVMDEEYRRTGGKPPYLGWEQAIEKLNERKDKKPAPAEPAPAPDDEITDDEVNALINPPKN